MPTIKRFFRYLGRHKYATTIVIFVALIAYLDSNSLYNRYQLYKEEVALKAEIEAYRSQYERDTRLYMELQRDPNAVVRIAREKYYMKNENEDVYIFEEDEATE
ncbi:MAG: septum formation initiator family protein [Bacteroidaceae bacterium]|jgi:cell division protein FtsB|nr:septum formation initiator family protein [Bacteroidaceae bacterium]MBR3733856.1 septum formation initiator family protein [Bacteroidaceae bacterium]MBR6714426.1 septum formation initiator family protein [Bacteroidaceae bacterium]